MQIVGSVQAVALAGGTRIDVDGDVTIVAAVVLGEPCTCAQFRSPDGELHTVPRHQIVDLVGGTLVDPQAEARAAFAAETADRQRRERESGLEPTPLRDNWRVTWHVMKRGTSLDEAVARLRGSLDLKSNFVDSAAIATALQSFGAPQERGQLRGWDQLRSSETAWASLTSQASTIARKILAASARAAA